MLRVSRETGELSTVMPGFGLNPFGGRMVADEHAIDFSSSDDGTTSSRLIQLPLGSGQEVVIADGLSRVQLLGLDGPELVFLDEVGTDAGSSNWWLRQVSRQGGSPSSVYPVTELKAAELVGSDVLLMEADEVTRVAPDGGAAARE